MHLKRLVKDDGLELFVAPREVGAVVPSSLSKEVSIVHVRASHDNILSWRVKGTPSDVLAALGLSPAGPASTVDAALDVARRYGSIDGAHHKAWVIDQMVRALTGRLYDDWVQDARTGADGQGDGEWDTGTAP